MQKNVSDEIIGDIIIQKLTGASVVVSFAEIARVAREQNRLRLAAQVTFPYPLLSISTLPPPPLPPSLAPPPPWPLSC